MEMQEKMGHMEIQSPSWSYRLKRPGLIVKLGVLAGVFLLLSGLFVFYFTQPSVSPKPSPHVSISANTSPVPGVQPFSSSLFASASPLLAGSAQVVEVPDTHTPLIYHGNEKLHEVALTFDDGPFPIYTAKVLDVLEKYHIKATFFSVGRQVAAFPDLTLRAYKAGYEIENHTWNHPVLTGLSLESQYWQLQNTSDAIQRVTHQRPFVMRPPYGEYNASSIQVATSLKLVTVTWNVDSLDWSRPGVNTILHNVLDHVKNGSIILMHDGGGDRSQTLEALPIIIQTLLDRGYHFVNIRQMLSRLPHDQNKM